MFLFLSFILKIFINLTRSKKDLLIKITLLEKELEIYKRQCSKRLNLNLVDKIIFTFLNIIGNIRNSISIVKPETVLKWQRELIKSFWSFKSTKKRIGRPPTPHSIKQLILKFKNENIYWGIKKIHGELLKLNINLDTKTIRNILREFRKKGKLKKSLIWKKFLEIQIDSIFAMDFFTVDTVLNQRYYVYFIIYHKTREIIQFAITQNPIREFVRQQIIEFEDRKDRVVYMIHDRAPQFYLDYSNYGIKDICTSIKAPNMNSIAERFIGSVRREALDHFIIFSGKQILNILTEYIEYYNFNRPHQGIDQGIPKGYNSTKEGDVVSKSVLSGLHHHYFRKTA